MDAHTNSIIKPSIDSHNLLSKLAAALPIDVSFRIHHISTPPTRTTALYSAPPDTRPDRTYCESHFLTASITAPNDEATSREREVLVYAVEILIYSTAYTSTFFVSKADSTGYLSLLHLRKGTPSPIRDITSSFLSHLIETHQRPNIRSVISLFARAQDQYLFPGSVEYGGKHVLDDRGLVRWWCRVLDPIIEESRKKKTISGWDAVNGYLTIPGIDSHETLSYVPKKTPPNSLWTIGHPLLEISRYSSEVPPRCLIPHFPDDPKARFLDELDEEVSKGSSILNGYWKSVRSISEFWEMMAFRQECSAGRLVGFIWIVFTPQSLLQPTERVIGDSQTSSLGTDSQAWDGVSDQSEVPESSFSYTTPATSFNLSSQTIPNSSPVKPDDSEAFRILKQSARSIRAPKLKRKKLTGLIIPRQPRIKTENQNGNKNYTFDGPEKTPYYAWNPEGRGQIVVDEPDYKRVTELLLRLDFANIELATSSSTRWINEVRSEVWGTMKDAWGKTVTGTKAVPTQLEAGAAGVNTLNIGLVRKKRKSPEPSLPSPPQQVNILSVGMIRKKPKV